MKFLASLALVAFTLISASPTFGAKIIKGSSNFCRLKCTSSICKTRKGFLECITRCKDMQTPLLRRCVRIGLKAGHKIPVNYHKHYKHHLKRHARSKAKPAADVSAINMKNLVNRCHVAKERVIYFQRNIIGTPFEGILADILYRIDSLIEQLLESTRADAFAIDNAAECTGLGSAVEDLFGKLVQSSYFNQYKNTAVPGAPPNIYYTQPPHKPNLPRVEYYSPGLPLTPHSGHKPHTTRDDVVAKQQNQLRKEIEEEMLKEQMESHEHAKTTAMPMKPSPPKSGKKHTKHEPLFE